MAYYVHDPADLVHADGFNLANAATTDAAAGWVLTCVLSAGGTIVHRTSPVRSWESVGNAGVARLDGPVTAAAALGVELLLDITALPTGAANRLIEIRHATNYAMKVEQNTDGTVKVINAANAVVWTSTALSTGLVRLFAAVGKGTGISDGDLVLNIYSTNPETSTSADQSYSTPIGNAGTADLTVARFPRVSSTAASTATVRVINAQAQDSLTPIGPLATTPAVVVSAVVATIDTTVPWGPSITGEAALTGGGPMAVGITFPTPVIRVPRTFAVPRTFIGVGAYAPVVTATTEDPVEASVAAVLVEAYAPSVAVHSRLWTAVSSTNIAAIAPTVTAVVTATVAGPAMAVEAEAPRPTISVGQAEQFFVPPGRQQRTGGRHPLFARMSRLIGLTLVKTAGVYRQVETPTAEEITAADIAYLGGHDYPVGQAEIDDLTAAGYGSYVESRVKVKTYV